MIDFVALKEDISLHEAAKKLGEWYGPRNTSTTIKKPIQVKQPEPNKPLDFKLILDPNHPYLKKRKIWPETAQYFGIGYCSKGIMQGRISIPIHDEYGKLVAYIGRDIADSNLKYKFPRGFRKSQVLFNLHRAKKKSNEEMIIVEGFFDLFRLHQAGFENVVAIMGSSMSKRQSELVIQHTRKVVLMFDGDKVGMRGMVDTAFELLKNISVKMIVLKWPKFQPDMIEEDELKKLLSGLI